MSNRSYSQRVALLIAGFTAVRMLLACFIELGNDEAYYWLYTHDLQWNYFDHPPMVALWGKIFTLNGLLDHYELFVRLGSIVSCAAATWFIFRAVSLFHSARAGWYAAVLYNTSFYAGLVSGLLLMPDSPQMVFWTLAIWMLARISRDEKKWNAWIFFGLAAGLCIMSKVHGVFLWGGLGLYTLLLKRKWLRLPQLYVSALITAALISPLLIWNIQHDFVTYRFHSERVTITGSADYGSFFGELAGQLLFNNPSNALLACVAVIALRKQMKASPFLSALSFIGLPMIVCLLFISIFRTVLPHWSGPGYVSLIPISAVYLAELNKRRWLNVSVGIAIAFLVCWPLAIQFYPGTYGSRQQQKLGWGDVTLDRYGWEEGGEKFLQFYKTQLAAGELSPNTPLVCPTWWGAHVEYYFAMPANLTMMGLGSMQQAHHYLWTNNDRKENADLDTALSIVPSDENFDAASHYSAYYHSITLEKTLTVNRGGKPAHHFFIYRLSGWKGNLPEVKPKRLDGQPI